MRVAIRAATARAVLAGVALSLAFGCGAQVTNLNPAASPLRFKPATAYALKVGVRSSPRSGQERGPGRPEEGLADFLADEQVFEQVVYPYRGIEPVDLVIEVESQGSFRPGGLSNFLTWFPGGLLLVPNLRGTRWYYDASATVEIVDAHTEQPIAEYSASSSHKIVHRSLSPGPLFSAAVVVPAIIKGARVSSPKEPYTSRLYAKTYLDLWRQVVAEMIRRDDDRLIATEIASARRPKGRVAMLGSSDGNRRASPPPAAVRTYPEKSGPRYGDLYSKQVAVVVGIDQYQSWPHLTGAHSDASRMASYLRGYGFDEVIEIYDGDATRTRLLSLLGNELREIVDEESLVFIYFAGHGQTETLPGGAKRGYLIPVDGAADDVFSTGISMDTVRDLSNRMTAKHVLYAIDACYSGLALMRGLSIPRTGSDYLRKLTSMRAVQILAAGSEGEQAVEIGGQGLFTTYLLRGLQGEADLDGDGAVTAQEIGTYVRPQVSTASGNRQTPQFGTIDGSGDVVFLQR